MSKMLKLTIPFCLLCAFCGFITTAALGESLKPSGHELTILIKTIDYLFADSFTAATNTAMQYNDTIPGQPIYHLLYASILHAQMMDGEDYSHEDEFMDNIDRANDALSDWVDKNPDDAWGYFFWASAYGYKAVWQSQKGSWFKALLAGLKAKARFSDALGLDSALYDAYTGMGSYHYWSSAKLKKVFPFISDNREDGLREMKLAMDSSLFSGKAAGIAYGWALLNERKYSEAIDVANRLNEMIPNGRTVIWLLASIYYANGNLQKASDYYGIIIKSLEEAGNQNDYNLIYCRYRRGVCEYGMRKYDVARAEFETLLAYDPPSKVKERLQKTFAHARDYLEKIKAQTAEAHR